MSRRDLYAECNVDNNPQELFIGECCSRCRNPECSRSTFGTSRFDQRVATWQERLFTNVPRMDSNDPRYKSFSGQKFLMIETGKIPEINTTRAPVWESLENTNEKKTLPVIQTTPHLEPPKVSSDEPLGKEETPPQKQVSTPAVQTLDKKAPVSLEAINELKSKNTPVNAQGVLLQGASKTETTQEKIVPQGAIVRFDE